MGDVCEEVDLHAGEFGELFAFDAFDFEARFHPEEVYYPCDYTDEKKYVDESRVHSIIPRREYLNGKGLRFVHYVDHDVWFSDVEGIDSGREVVVGNDVVVRGSGAPIVVDAIEFVGEFGAFVGRKEEVGELETEAVSVVRDGYLLEVADALALVIYGGFHGYVVCVPGRNCNRLTDYFVG